MNGIESMFSTTPIEIQRAAELTPSQKIELLRQWEQDCRQLISASGEGMIARYPGRASEMLCQVERALRELRAQ
jgi:hypothetical protein